MRTFRPFWRVLPGMASGCMHMCFALSLFLAAGAAQASDHTVSATNIALGIGCQSNAVNLTKITGLKNGNFAYLKGSVPLLWFSDDNSGSYDGAFANGVRCTLSGGTLTISATSGDKLLGFSITIASDGDTAVIVSTQVTYQGPATGPATVFFRAMLPNLSFNVPSSTGGRAMAMVPQMSGGVVPLSPGTSLGASLAGNTKVQPSVFGLPTNLNVMEIAEVYDSGGRGGLFFADLDGDYGQNIAPLQFNLANPMISGYWTALLKLNQPVTLPRLAIGAHPSGDWHNAVDYYVSHRSPAWTFPDTPGWLREAGGIYMLGVAGGGSFLNTFPATAISDNYFGIKTFNCTGTPPPPSSAPGNNPGKRCLVDVYNDAQLLGAKVLYLTEWWDHPLNCAKFKDCPDYYANKGDWIVNGNLGGASALKEGVAQVHTAGGKVILYLEPYLVANTSTLLCGTAGCGSSPPTGPSNGWQAQPGPPIPPTYAAGDICLYGPANECMATTNTQWQDYLIDRAVSLMQATGVDGFYLDSWGWQLNWPITTTSENVAYTSQQWTAAALRFVDRFRAAIRGANPKGDVIVMGENNTGQLPFHWDGGSAADLSYWNSTFAQDGGVLLASPIRYAMPNANFFVSGSGILNSKNSGGVNGTALSSINQVIASGHNLALGPFFLLNVMQVGTVTGTNKGNPTLVTPTYSSSAPPPFDQSVYCYIKSLMQLRSPVYKNNTCSSPINKTFKDALVYGSQLPMPATTSRDVVAFMYQGATNQVLAIVNIGGSTISSVSVTTPGLGIEIPWARAWSTVLKPSSKATKVTVALNKVTIEKFAPAPNNARDPMGGVVIFARPCTGGGGCTTPQIYNVTPLVPLMNESFASAPYGNSMANWTDWMVSGGQAVASGRWSLGAVTTRIRDSTTQTPFLQVKSANKNSLLFYDSFGGGDFTYRGGITFDSTFGGAGLSFRLSDNPQTDAGIQGYDVILTNGPLAISSSGGGPGTLALWKRGSTAPLHSLTLPYALAPGQTYQVSVTARTTWSTPAAFGTACDPSCPTWPASTSFTVSILPAGTGDTLSFTATDNAPYLSGRFGVNSNADAHFTCLQANGSQATDGAMPPGCAPIVSGGTVPPPGSHPPPSGSRPSQ